MTTRYKTVFKVTILSVDQYPTADYDLESISYGIASGDWVGRVEQVSCDEIAPVAFIEGCAALDISPAALGLDHEGAPLYCNRCGEDLSPGPHECDRDD